ncbi:MAG TPA: OFA family MFS transporter [Candidatus Wallbacteria bacterium]|nr:OFA family MFS transporter [Candidatus Wallbacteria bacterium]
MNSNQPELSALGMPAEKGRWGLIAIGAVIFFFIGTIYSWSVFRGPIQKIFGCSATAAGAPYMLFFAVQAFLMPFIGPYVDRFNPGRVILANGTLMSFGLILASYSSNIYEFTAAFSFVFGLGATAVYAAPIALASKWFVDKKGFAIGLTLFGMGLAPLVMAPAAVKLIALYGVLETLRILGAIIFAVILLLFYPIKFPPPGYVPAGWVQQEASAAADSIEYPRGLMLRSASFYGLWFCFMTASACGLMVIGITHQVAVEMYKISEASAAFAISVFAFFNALGRPFWGLVIDRLNPKITAYVTFGLMGAASLALARGTAQNAFIFYAAVPLVWFCYGGWLSIAPSLTANFFGVKNSSRNYGVVFTAFGAGAIIGNLLAGRVKDFYGSYSPAFYIMAACSLAGIVAASLSLARPRNGRI